MSARDNERETGSRKLKPRPSDTMTDTKAALPPRPKRLGLSEGIDETQDMTRQSDGKNSGEAS